VLCGCRRVQNASSGVRTSLCDNLTIQHESLPGVNTALGYNAGPDPESTNLNYATSIGAGAVVSASNTLVLGGPLGSEANRYKRRSALPIDSGRS
jgi:hypothetical protein